MNSEVVEVQVRAVLPLEGSFAVFIGNTEKVFVIYVDETVGAAISMFMRGVAKERPLTHDLVGHILMAFGAKVERVIINHMQGSVFHARLILTAENELHSKKVVELDARPSDSIALAVQQSAPIYVAAEVWEAVEDMSETLQKIEKQGEEAKLAAESAAASTGDDDDDDDDIENISDAEIDAIANQSGISPSGDTYDDGYGGIDDDDDEGEEWKKKE
ncbi:MAG: bifunctional nuclease family protein [Verrucomicrobiaceae bacterium]|nr:bifunctional nuclease family protein [Verrucomicrobiaceae bacterium]